MELNNQYVARNLTMLGLFQAIKASEATNSFLITYFSNIGMFIKICNLRYHWRLRNLEFNALRFLDVHFSL